MGILKFFLQYTFVGEGFFMERMSLQRLTGTRGDGGRCLPQGFVKVCVSCKADVSTLMLRLPTH